MSQAPSLTRAGRNRRPAEERKVNWQVVLFDIDLNEAEIQAVTAVLTSRWIAMGAITAAFEDEFAAALGVSQAVAVSSGTAALHLAVQALGLGPSDEVIVPSLSFVASAATVALTGARPVFAEVCGAHNLTLDPADVARRITPRTRAIVAMHYGGYPADMVALQALARRHGLALIEDAAHAPVVRTPQGMLGTIGDIGCFSFFATKNIAMGEGGMVVARDEALLRRIRAMRAHCMTSSSWDKHHGRASSYDVNGLGLNYRPTDIGAAIGRVQLTKLHADRQQRHRLIKTYMDQLQGIPGIRLPFSDYAGDSAYHLLPIILAPEMSRELLQHELKGAGIQSSVHYPPTHLFSYYRDVYQYRDGDLPVTEAVAAREVSLPLHVRMTADQVLFVTQTIRRIMERGT
jgi:dTDP-4-amino-4,6-dideoxygalactose transaminase